MMKSTTLFYDDEKEAATDSLRSSRAQNFRRSATVEELEMIQSQSPPPASRNLDLWKRTKKNGSDNDNEDSAASSDETSVSSDEHDNDSLAKEPLIGEVEISPKDEKDTGDAKKGQNTDVDKYAASRMMTPLQERMNAITMIPAPALALYIALSGCWLQASVVDEARSGGTDLSGASCIDRSQWWSWMLPPAGLPPLPVMFLILGSVLHTPCSMLYHWTCASLPAGPARLNHWTRRLDQGMIHIGSALWCYGTSGSWQYFFVNLLYNIDCFIKQFEEEVRPKRNQTRVGLAIFAYMLPVLIRLHDVLLFAKLMFSLSLSAYFFILYPAGGWSHSIFHLIMMFIPYFCVQAAMQLPISQETMWNAAQCVVLHEQQQANL